MNSVHKFNTTEVDPRNTSDDMITLFDNATLRLNLPTRPYFKYNIVEAFCVVSSAGVKLFAGFL